MLKTLRADGFLATLFERRESVGGIWSYSDNPEYTTVLKSEGPRYYYDEANCITEADRPMIDQGQTQTSANSHVASATILCLIVRDILELLEPTGIRTQY